MGREMFTIQSTPTAADVYLLKSSQKNNAKAFKPSHNSNIFYITVQNNSELEQSRSMVESTREILSSNGKISPVHKIAFENWINLSTCNQLKSDFKTVFFCTICIENVSERGHRDSYVESKLTVESEKCWITTETIQNFCKRGLKITRKKHQLQLNASTAERANLPAQWEKCNNDDWAEIHSIFLEK